MKITDYFSHFIPPSRKTMGMPVDEYERFAGSSSLGMFARMLSALRLLRKKSC